MNKKLLLKAKKHVSLIILVGILGVLFIGTLTVSWLSRKTQDLRQQASKDDGIVVVGPMTVPNSTFPLNQPASIDLGINTNSLQIDGVQLFFSINSSVGSSFDFEIVPQSGLQLVAENIQDQGNGQYNVQVLAIGQVAQPFSTGGNTVVFGRLVFTPTQEGTVTLNFDNSGSRATVYQSNPVEDELRTLSSFSVQAVDTSTPTPTPTPTPGTGGNNSTPTPTPTPTSSSTGGVIIKQCNESCTSHADCTSNLACISGVCRLASNPSNTSCQGVADQGIHRSCNEYCADNNECASGLTCHFNRCRNPQNVNNTSCQNPTPTPTAKSGTGGSTTTRTPTPTPRPTSTTNSVAQSLTSPNPTPLTNVFGSGSGQDDSTTFTPTPMPTSGTVTPVPDLLPEEQADTFSKLPQILLIAAIISLPILFFTPLLIAKMAKKKPHPVANSGLEHTVTPRPEPPKTNTITSPSATTEKMKSFAGITPASSKPETEVKIPDQKNS